MGNETIDDVVAEVASGVEEINSQTAADLETQAKGEEGGDGTQGAEVKAEDTVDSLRAELEKSEKGRKELRSLHDRQMGELRDDQKALNASVKQMAEVITSQHTKTQAENDADHEAYLEKLGAEFFPDDPAQGAAFARLIDKQGGGWVEKNRRAVEELRKELQGYGRAADSDYRQHKEAVDELIDEGMSYEAALKHAVKYSSGGKASQPNKSAAPGKAGGGAGAVDPLP